jgi:TatD DNase family protein
MVDSHVHLNHSDFDADLDAVLERAQRAGVTRLINIGYDLDSSLETISLTERYPVVYGAVGVHPHDARTYDDEVERELERMVDNEKVVAVGEIGLDFYRDLTARDRQRDVFARQLDLAKRRNMPVIIHCRDAFEDVVGILAERGERHHGIFHAFSGDESMAKRVLDLGFHIGIGGVVTFKNSNLAEVVAKMPAGAIVLETDCPYLAPMPFRGKRNEPAYLTYVVDKILEVTRETPEELTKRTDDNLADALGLTN